MKCPNCPDVTLQVYRTLRISPSEARRYRRACPQCGHQPPVTTVKGEVTEVVHAMWPPDRKSGETTTGSAKNAQ